MKKLLGYFFILLLTIGFTGFFDGGTGVKMLAFLLLVPLISLCIAIITKNSISMEIRSQAIVNKNKYVTINIDITKKNIIPTAFIEIKTFCTQHFNKNFDTDTYRTILFAEKKSTISYNLESKVSGNAEIKIDSIYISDYLGMFRFKLKNIKVNSLNITIVPDIHEINKTSVFLRSICDSIISDDDEETENTGLSTNSISGYEHREYVQGDSLKKINWKLSAKKGNLMVRLDEAVSSVNLTFVMDFIKEKYIANDLYELLLEERLVEGMLSMINSFVKQGITCDLLYVSNGILYSKTLSNSEDVLATAIDITKNSFTANTTKDSIMLAEGIMNKSGIFIIYGMVYNQELHKNLEKANDKGINIHKVFPQIQGAKGENTWRISEDYDVKKIT